LQRATPGHEGCVVGAKPTLAACLLVALALGACGSTKRDDDAAAVAERFHAALESGDTRAACNDLSEETRSKLEQDEGKPCREAIRSLKIPKGGTATVKRAEITSAYVRLTEGSADFLDEGPDGWKISAAGCKPSSPDKPYNCELEG
jgi:hypothetical protein